MDATTILLVLVTRSWNGKFKLTSKGRFETRQAAEARLKELVDRCKKCGLDVPDYRVCDQAQLKELQTERAANRDARRKQGAVKAAKTRAKRAASGAKPQFICCPTCGAKSKKLYSEMGGLQTRKCQKGHTFEYDKWIADRAFWGPIMGSGVPDPYGKVKLKP